MLYLIHKICTILERPLPLCTSKWQTTGCWQAQPVFSAPSNSQRRMRAAMSHISSDSQQVRKLLQSQTQKQPAEAQNTVTIYLLILALISCLGAMRLGMNRKLGLVRCCWDQCKLRHHFASFVIGGCLLIFFKPLA